MKPTGQYLKDYRPPAYLVDTVDLHFTLGEDTTRVRGRFACRLQQETVGELPPLILFGKELKTVALAIDGRQLADHACPITDETMTIDVVREQFVVEVEVDICPSANTALEGLYLSRGNFFTQCEAEGFRRICWFPDRPDVLAVYTVTIEAAASCPVLLANGNLIDKGELAGGRHFARWHDPFPKPSYLFALVAGDFHCIRDAFTTVSGRTIDLSIYVQEHNRRKCGHAMMALKKAMTWDEDVYGLEYDLDQYMIVAVDDFNMGAMENKGLNIFNSAYVLASPETATDHDFAAIEAVIAHEYFHNYTGNRVTCRDWFQLSLKEGLTVFRDQEFSKDVVDGPLKRIHDVRILRDHQFPEDAGPMAHPVQPASYIEINNFYTVTVYEKGAEIIRMLHTLLGRDSFIRGVRLYLADQDGKAATIDDFIAAMEQVSGRDLQQFKLWYSQAGTPRLAVTDSYEATTYSLTVKQQCPPTPGQDAKEAMHIPVVVGLLGRDGNPLTIGGRDLQAGTSQSILLEICRETETFVFENIAEKPVPSLLRTFSAPVILDYEYRDEDLQLLLVHDSDPFNRWEAGQRLAAKLLLALIDDFQQGRVLVLPPWYVAVTAKLLDDAVTEKSFLAMLLELPSETFLAEQMACIDVDAIHLVRQFVRRTLALELRHSFLRIYREMIDASYCYTLEARGRRSLKNISLGYLSALDDEDFHALAFRQFSESDNMTDTLAAFRCLVHSSCPRKGRVIEEFYASWKADSLVLDKWFAVQATAPFFTTLDEVKTLLGHPDFSIRNPNKVRALIGAFCGGNQYVFNNQDGSGYQFLADCVLELDLINPQIAARLLTRFSRWQRMPSDRKNRMQQELHRIQGRKTLSQDVYEVVAKTLGN